MPDWRTRDVNTVEREQPEGRLFRPATVGRWTVAALLLSAILAWAGCDSAVRPPVSTPPDALVITAVLDPGSARQRLLLSRVSPADDSAPDLVQDATVRIEGTALRRLPADSVDRRASRRQDTYNYVADSLDVLPGHTYRLTIEREGRRVAQGHARVPGVFTGDARGLRLTWTPSRGASRYRVVISRRESSGSDPAWERTYITTDTSVTIEPDGRFRSGEHHVLIQAADENLAAFQQQKTDQAGVEGALGVFGAVTTASGRVTLREKEADDRAASKHADR